MKKTLLLQIHFIFLFLILSVFFVWLSTKGINNPDLAAYTELVNTFSGLTLSIEPVLGVFSAASIWLSDSLGVSAVSMTYFFYIFFIQVFLFFGFANLTKSHIRGLILVYLWFMLYGTMHGLIQIRFGLANAIFVFLVSLLFKKISLLKFNIVAALPFGVHYSSVIAILLIVFTKMRLALFNKNSYFILHVGFIIALLLSKSQWLFSILPNFLYARVAHYLQSPQSFSSVIVYLSLVIYISLMTSPKMPDKKINALKYFGALSFLTYIIVPEQEMFVRLGIPFQYLALVYFILTFKYKKLLLRTTLPLLVFFIYKFYSNTNALIGYL